MQGLRKLSEVSATCKVCDDNQATTYRFALTRELDMDTVNGLIHPYFNAREEKEVEKPKNKWHKGGVENKVVPITYSFVLDI